MHHDIVIHTFLTYMHCHVKFITVVCKCMHAYMNLHGVQRVKENSVCLVASWTLVWYASIRHGSLRSQFVSSSTAAILSIEST